MAERSFRKIGLLRNIHCQHRPDVTFLTTSLYPLFKGILFVKKHVKIVSGMNVSGAWVK